MRRRTVLHGQAAHDLVMAAGLEMMADEILKELGPDTSFALFIDWRDGQPLSYVSDVPRPRVIPILEEWLAKAPAVFSFDRKAPRVSGDMSALEKKCEELGKQMIEEDIDVVLLLVTWGDDGGVAWFTSMERGRQVVEGWVRGEKGRS